MDRYMLEQYYTQITRFATSAFMRMKLGQAFTRRDIAPHVFENKDDAHDFLASLDAQQHQSSDDGALRMRVPRCFALACAPQKVEGDGGRGSLGMRRVSD